MTNEHNRILERAHSLVLNADYRPISVIPPSHITWQESFKAVWTQSLDIVETYSGLTVRTPCKEFEVPSVLRSRVYVKRHLREVQFSKSNVFMRDHYMCQYCGRPGIGVELSDSGVAVTGMVTMRNGIKVSVRPGRDLTYDHYKPRSRGGRTNWENIVTACRPCNNKKGNGNRMRPMKEPRRPTYEELASFMRRQPIIVPSESWIPYLEWIGPIRVRDPFGGDYHVR